MKKIFVTTLMLFSFISIQAQRNLMTVGVNAGMSVPMGDFSDFASTGFGLNGNFVYGLSDIFEVVGSLGFISWSRDIPKIDETTSSSVDGSFTSIPLLAGMRYYFPQRNFMPYVTAELGLHIFTTSDFTKTIDGNKEDTNSGSTDVDFGFGVGGGAIYEVSKGFKVDGNLKYNVINHSPLSYSNLTLQVGALFDIN